MASREKTNRGLVMKRKDWFGTGVAFLIAGAAVFAADPVKKEDPIEKIGRASCRERVCQYV
jgi:hypothetical protein